MNFWVMSQGLLLPPVVKWHHRSLWRGDKSNGPFVCCELLLCHPRGSITRTLQGKLAHAAPPPPLCHPPTLDLLCIFTRARCSSNLQCHILQGEKNPMPLWRKHRPMLCYTFWRSSRERAAALARSNMTPNRGKPLEPMYFMWGGNGISDNQVVSLPSSKGLNQLLIWCGNWKYKNKQTYNTTALNKKSFCTYRPITSLHKTLSQGRSLEAATRPSHLQRAHRRWESLLQCRCKCWASVSLASPAAPEAATAAGAAGAARAAETAVPLPVLLCFLCLAGLMLETLSPRFRFPLGFEAAGPGTGKPQRLPRFDTGITTVWKNEMCPAKWKQTSGC